MRAAVVNKDHPNMCTKNNNQSLINKFSSRADHFLAIIFTQHALSTWQSLQNLEMEIFSIVWFVDIFFHHPHTLLIAIRIKFCDYTTQLLFGFRFRLEHTI